jgi:hypothetical protein
MVGANATIGSTGNKDVGLVYAPNGKVTFDGTTGLTSKGSAFARDITLQGVTNSPVLLRPRIRAVDVPAAPASELHRPAAAPYDAADTDADLPLQRDDAPQQRLLRPVVGDQPGLPLRGERIGDVRGERPVATFEFHQ